jgi:hypothetical protein
MSDPAVLAPLWAVIGFPDPHNPLLLHRSQHTEWCWVMGSMVVQSSVLSGNVILTGVVTGSTGFDGIGLGNFVCKCSPDPQMMRKDWRRGQTGPPHILNKVTSKCGRIEISKWPYVTSQRGRMLQNFVPCTIPAADKSHPSRPKSDRSCGRIFVASDLIANITKKFIECWYPLPGISTVLHVFIAIVLAIRVQFVLTNASRKHLGGHGEEWRGQGWLN